MHLAARKWCSMQLLCGLNAACSLACSRLYGRTVVWVVHPCMGARKTTNSQEQRVLITMQ